MSRVLRPPPPVEADIEVSDVVWVVGVGSPSDFDMATDSGAGGPVEGKHLAFTLVLGEPDAEDSLGR